LWPERLAEELDVSREELGAALRALADRGLLRWEAPERTGGIEILRPGEPLRIDEAAMNARRARELKKLDRMVGYGYAGCRRRYILEYFGDKPGWDRCGDCDACRDGATGGAGVRPLSPGEELVVRKALSCLARLGEPSTRATIARVLVASNHESVQSQRYQRLSTWGLLSNLSQPEVERILDELERAGALERSFRKALVNGRDREFAVLWLTPLGSGVMAAREPGFTMRYPLGTRAARSRPATSTSAPVGVARDLLAHLREVRTRLAKEADVPAYCVAPNRTIEEMARERPVTRGSMMGLHGMGPERYRLYGVHFLEALRSWSGS
jgi:ATP-dependent DNA helicase RecQ